MTSEVDIVSHLITVAPVVAVLVWVVLYFRAKEKEYKEEIRELHAEQKEYTREVVGVANDLNNTLKELVTEIKKT